MDMDKEIYGYIYKITNTVNGKVYIGLTTRSFDKRYQAKGEGIERVYGYHMKQRKYGSYYNEHLLNSIEKYGFEAFEVIKEFDVAYSEEELKEKERKWISHYKCNNADYGYNRTEGGDSFLKGEDNLSYKGFVVISPNGQVSKEMTKNEAVNYLNLNEGTISDLAREKTCYIGNYENIRYIRVLHSEDYLKERALYKNNEEFENMCKHMVEEAKILYEKKKEEFREICKNRTGEKSYWYGKHHSEEELKKMSEASKGHEVSEEARKKIGEWHKGKYVSEETRKKMSEASKDRKGIKNNNSKILICIFTDGRIIKNCLKGLAEELGVDKGLIRRVLKSHKPYKVIKAQNKTHLEHLKSLEGIIIMEEKDYLKENTNINDDKAS